MGTDHQTWSLCRWGTREALHRGKHRYLDAHAAACMEPSLLQGFAPPQKPYDFGSSGARNATSFEPVRSSLARRGSSHHVRYFAILNPALRRAPLLQQLGFFFFFCFVFFVFFAAALVWPPATWEEQ